MAYLQPGYEPPLKGKGSKLSAKMVKFIDHYMGDCQMNGSKAFIAAGYKAHDKAAINRYSTRLLRHPLISKEIARRQGLHRERMEFSADFLLAKLMTIINDGDTKTADQLRAIELAGKSIALWKERQEISGPDGKAIEMEQKITEEVNEFTSRIARLAESGRTSGVVKLVK